jgi:hypothetical protein
MWTTEGVEFESLWGQELSLLRIVYSGSETHPAYYHGGKAEVA